MSTNPENFVRIHRTVFAVGSPKVAEISKFCFGSPKNLGDGGLNLPHRRVGSTTEILRVHTAPLYFTPSIFREFLKSQKFDHFLRGHSSAMGRNSKKRKMGRGIFVLNAQKILCDILTTATPSKPRVQVPTPEIFWKQSRILGSPLRG